MPKKFGNNTKAAEARAKKDEKKQIEQAKKEKQIEDEFWKDDDKHVNKKQQRKEDRDVKKMEQSDRKKELARLHDEEMTLAEASAKTATRPAAKVTQIQIQAIREKQAAASRSGGVAVAAAAPAQKKQKKKRSEEDESEDDEADLIENTNRLLFEGEEARSVNEAIKLLSVNDGDTDDRHPEKRMRAVYRAFEERTMAQLKAENPGMRHTQLQQLAFKMFKSSPENPLNKETN